MMRPEHAGFWRWQFLSVIVRVHLQFRIVFDEVFHAAAAILVTD